MRLQEKVAIGLDELAIFTKINLNNGEPLLRNFTNATGVLPHPVSYFHLMKLRSLIKQPCNSILGHADNRHYPKTAQGECPMQWAECFWAIQTRLALFFWN